MKTKTKLKTKTKTKTKIKIKINFIFYLILFFIFVFKYLFWENLLHKTKIVSLRWNLIPRLTRICRIQWWCFFFLLRPETLFLGKFGPKNKDYQFKLKFGTQNNLNVQNLVLMFTLSVFEGKCLFWANLVQTVKIVSLSWNLVASLIRIWRIQWCCSLFLFLTGNTCFGQSWYIKSELSVQAEVLYTLSKHVLLHLKSCSMRGASLHPVFMGNCPTISYAF